MHRNQFLLLILSMGLCAFTMPQCQFADMENGTKNFSMINAGTEAKVLERGWECEEYSGSELVQPSGSGKVLKLCHTTDSTNLADIAILVSGAQVIKVCVVRDEQNDALCASGGFPAEISAEFQKYYCSFAASVSATNAALTDVRVDLSGLAVGGAIDLCQIPD